MVTAEAFQFLEELKINNNTEWFHSQKKRYEDYKKWYYALIADLLEEMKKHDPKLEPLEVKHCTFRINRDIRFSKDKSPYKTNMGIWLSQNKNSKNSPGYYLHYEKGNSFIAGGVWCPESEELKKIRKEIAFFYDDLENIVSNTNFKSTFTKLSDDESSKLKKAPKGYEPEHPAIEFLKLKSFTSSYKINDKDFNKSNFVQEVTQKWLHLKPLNDFLTRALETEE
ncbi:uncharacterized protein (TIGR02453 family) [Flavobacterium croceum DSM 17960]|uniref:Uncharacterized protein (TIGR02453 family) n=1 Tax=Flavobacterium croceum DSM 17960 TaxID=1121886 RepID=A0A2S4N6P9_9FLAO|nr:DUF2461 domain-containing protein [Flavobacterium croceum]POS01398.1 uncharacterized protein (TIGR02453 family) [Flavobacterium croceum DSM 17960]